MVVGVGGDRGVVGGLAAGQPSARARLGRERLGVEVGVQPVADERERLGPQLRNARLGDAQLVGDPVHRPLREEVVRHHLAQPFRQRQHGVDQVGAALAVEQHGLRRLLAGRQQLLAALLDDRLVVQHGGAVHVLLEPVQRLGVDAELGGQLAASGRVAELDRELVGGPLHPPRLGPHRAAGPVGAAQLVEQGAADAVGRVALEGDAPVRVEAAGRLGEAEHGRRLQIVLSDVPRKPPGHVAHGLPDERQVLVDEPSLHRAPVGAFRRDSSCVHIPRFRALGVCAHRPPGRSLPTPPPPVGLAEGASADQRACRARLVPQAAAGLAETSGMAERREPAGSPRDAWTTAVVVDDWELLRLGLRAALGQLGVWVIAEAALARDGLRSARDSGAGLLVLGATSDLPARLAVTRAKAPQEPPTVLALASLPDPEELAGLLAAGVDGLLLRSTGVAELADALELLPLLVGVIGLAAVGPGEPLLTEKEREVLARLAEGGSNRAIAEALSVTPATVKTHLAHIYEKLGASDRRDALVRAIALGILR